ncbi:MULTISPECIES: Stk1 family PASTA domain-containing Ser/Thr kinase [unclassified Curtobacterium]|uniref:Stk1 family PASTA domain-containing Ser/Thr kinase n=1 Tax=unclassified Curtobacterium TaxID=257496 RepID=UPI001C64D137|nr:MULTISPECIES: Stk1 family PASTA domain-containing Ser/Thr kinase [unclassified Curtobacterium]
MNAATDPMIGRMIDQRYRVRSRIARGGMATVYLATDVRLERRVAIKIMHGHLADDAAFRGRFIQEARSAARLSHPNVVGVFDQGQETDCTYIVMEYIPGITLRDLLQEHRALTSDQALDILRAVLAGLASAHRAGIVHRDLKPENVLLADDGRIKLGDFGLARAATANTATGAALLGTIAYLSPELVTRGVADTRSDIYAVGIMLYEMLTGEQPYKGDQPMQIAYQHANDTVPAPSASNPAVPPELDDVVRWATARDPDERPRDARAMLDGLAGIDERMSGPRATSVLHPAGTTTVLPLDAAPADTTMLGPRGPLAPPRSPIGPQRSTASAPRFPPTASDSVETALAPAAGRLAHTTARRRRRGWVLLAVVVVVALVVGVVAWWFGPGPGGNVRVPEVAGKSVSQARRLIEERGLHAASSTGARPDAVVHAGAVSATAPDARRIVTRGTTIRILVSSGPRPIVLPAIVGQPVATVRSELAPHFTLEQLRYRFDGSAAAGTVLAATGTTEAGDDVDLTTVHQYGERMPVRLTVSLGAVPDVVGKSSDAATAALEAVGLDAGQAPGQYSDDVPTGDVIKAILPADPVVKGSTVQLVVSKGPVPITLPDVRKKPIDQAASTLQALGLHVSYPDCTNVLCSFYDWKSSLPVSATDPAPGSTVHKGDTITLDYEQ